jgi:hypothetical protein
MVKSDWEQIHREVCLANEEEREKKKKKTVLLYDNSKEQPRILFIT